ncbi:winged helix-turn-helix transcriptional regulator [Sedimentibacter sp. MB31-C6]|uniref:winged helix-turn-helix transcriptional regulator n=1 Tax=Sedimentibacter sp. MB31-C6 TaxID=3109366 RepID=UPI002DDD6F55|nr:winged helix-turn-helix transcriptional regulator [Sedimentibacter sp. MB36-C1]WSI05105.1 winged helix-turn-helix transcriptional regulator [Sedimentibacter sp. MB36-C1]
MRNINKKLIDFFTNDKFKVLVVLNKHQIQVQEATFSPLTQQEISEILHYSKAKINQIINELIDNEFIEFYNNTKGRYVITKKAIDILKIFNDEEIV